MTALGATRAPLADRKDDLYETSPEVVRALIRVERLPHRIWEPACGRGNIVGELRRAGHEVIATDLVNRGCPDSEYGVDFLLEWQKREVEAIVTNPPYKLAEEFVSRGLALCPKVCMLLRLAFLESERRSSILDGGQLARVYVFRNRLPMMHREGWSGPVAGSSIAFAWFVWDRCHYGPAELHRVSWGKRVELA